MKARRTRLWMLVLFPALFLLVVACAPITQGTSSPAPTPEPTRAGDRPTDTAAETKTSARATATKQTKSAEGRKERANCLDNGDVDDIRDEYNANPYRAESIYIDRWMCLEGKVVHFIDEQRLGVELEIEDGWTIRFSKLEPSPRATPNYGYEVAQEEWEAEWEEWENWIKSVSSIGDRVMFECMIRGLSGPDWRPPLPPGTPLFRNCAVLSAQGGVVFGPTAGPAPTATPLPTRTPTPTPWPTGTPLPCKAVEFIDERWEALLRINCPEGEVTIERELGGGEYDVGYINEGPAPNISFYFTDPEYQRGTYDHRARWGQQSVYAIMSPEAIVAKGWMTEELAESIVQKTGLDWIEIDAGEIWKAPPEAAARIIGRWQVGAPLLKISMETREREIRMEFRLRLRP